MVTRSKSFGPSASTADTKTPIGSAYKVPQSGTIRRIRITSYQGTTDKSDTAVLTLESDQQKGPFEFACAPASHEITVGGKIQTEEIEVDIPVMAQEEITLSLTASEALEETTASILWE